MSYPEPVYHDDDGEPSATLRTADAPADVTYPNGNRVHHLATGAVTRGLFGLYRFDMGPEPSGPGPHFHRTIDESFYILSGTITIHDGRAWGERHAGDFIHVPPGGIHGFRNESGAPASMLLHFAPGAPREAYFEGLARAAAEGGLSDQDLTAFYLRHDNIWVRGGGAG